MFNGPLVEAPHQWKDLIKAWRIIGHRFVKGYPHLNCKEEPLYPEVSGETLEKVDEIFREFRSQFSYRREEKDVWGYLKKTVGCFTGKTIYEGDCDDFPPELFDRLKHIIPPNAMRHCISKIGDEAHLVLALTFKETTLILDNRQMQPLPITHPNFDNYQWIMCSEPGSDMWRSMEE